MRCFVAIELPDPSPLVALQKRLRGRVPGVRWTPPEQIHLTLKFLGEVHDSQMRDITAALNNAASESSDFDLVVGGLGWFPPRGPVRVIWAGFRDIPTALFDCQRSCEAHLEPCGFPAEHRAFTPHLTLGRVRTIAEPEEVHAILRGASDFVCLPFHATSLVLFQSLLQPAGSVHLPLARFPLSTATR